MNDKAEQEIDFYYPTTHALAYWKKLLERLQERVKMVENKIKGLENDNLRN